MLESSPQARNINSSQQKESMSDSNEQRRIHLDWQRFSKSRRKRLHWKIKNEHVNGVTLDYGKITKSYL